MIKNFITIGSFPYYNKKVTNFYPDFLKYTRNHKVKIKELYYLELLRSEYDKISDFESFCDSLPNLYSNDGRFLLTLLKRNISLVNDSNVDIIVNSIINHEEIVKCYKDVVYLLNNEGYDMRANISAVKEHTKDFVDFSTIYNSGEPDFEMFTYHWLESSTSKKVYIPLFLSIDTLFIKS